MKIFLITSKLNFKTAGGSVVDLHLKARGLLELGHDVTVVTAFSRDNNIIRQLPYKIREEFVPYKGLLGLQYGVYKIIRKYEKETDAFYIDGHIFLYGAGFYRLMGGGIPIVAFFNIRLNSWGDTQGNIVNPSIYRRAKKSIRYFLERWIGAPIANYLDAFIFTTPMVEKLYHDFGIGKFRPSVVIEDFVATKEIMERHPMDAEKIKAHHENAKIITIFSTGRMIPEKGFDLIIRAFSRLKEKNKYLVIMSGNGPDKERLEKMVADLNLRPYFEFPGWVEKPQLGKFFEDAHIFVLPKWWIEYSSVLLTEAMAFGSVCIIPGGGALEWFTEGAALTFKNDDVNELARQIEKLGSDTDLRINLAKRILKKAEELDYKNLAIRLEQVIKSCV